MPERNLGRAAVRNHAHHGPPESGTQSARTGAPCSRSARSLIHLFSVVGGENGRTRLVPTPGVPLRQSSERADGTLRMRAEPL